MAQAEGTIVQCIGAVIDIQFPREAMPNIYDALTLVEEADSFAAEWIEPITGGRIPVLPIPAVVGVHVGPAVGVAYECERPLR